MRFAPDIHQRRSIRLSDYDYSTAGTYFITICTFERECLFNDRELQSIQQYITDNPATWQEDENHPAHL